MKMPPTIDDSVLGIGSMGPKRWVQTLAVMKAKDVLARMGSSKGTVCGADTICVVDDIIFGQPEHEAEAASMLRLMTNRKHDVYTGWCLLDVSSTRNCVHCDVVEVSMGELSDVEIQTYLSSGGWRGKAGAYNVRERIDAGWPISCDGDLTSVMGLPMKRLLKEIEGSLS